MSFSRLLIVAGLAGLTLAVAPAMAMDCNKGRDCASCHTLSKDEAAGLLKSMGGTVKSIRPAPIKGMFELLMEREGKQGLIYIDYAKKHLMQGFIVDFENRKKVISHEQEVPQLKNPALVDVKAVPAEHGLMMGNPGGARKMYVFTDPGCEYCRKQHQELKKLVRLVPDLAVYVMLYPLPQRPESYDISRAVLTFRDQATLDKAFEGAALPGVGTLDGVAPLDEIIKFARRNSIAATPSLVLQDGRVHAGFKTAEEIAGLLSGK